MLGIAGKKNMERTKFRPKNLLYRTTASGSAMTVMRAVVHTAKRRVKARPASIEGSLRITR